MYAFPYSGRVKTDTGIQSCFLQLYKGLGHLVPHYCTIPY